MTDLRALFHDLIRFETELWNSIDARLLDEAGLSLGSFETLQTIARIPSCRVQDIARELGITVGGTSKLVDRLEIAGFCTRQVDPADRRSSTIALTAVGTETVTRALAVFDRELEHRLGSALTPEALAGLGSVLSTLRSVGADPTPPTGGRPR